MLLPTFIAALHLATSFSTTAASHVPVGAGSGSFRLPLGSDSIRHRMKRHNLDGKNDISRKLAGASRIESLVAPTVGLANSSPIDVVTENKLSKREADQSQADNDSCKAEDGSTMLGCVIVTGVAVVFVAVFMTWVGVNVYRLYFVTSPLANENINGKTAPTYEDFNKLPEDVKQYIEQNTQDPSFQANLDKAKDAGLISDDPKTAEANLRTYLDQYTKNDGTGIEGPQVQNKLASNYKVLDAATQAKLQSDYPNTLDLQASWAKFDPMQAAQAAGLQPYIGTNNQILQSNFDAVNSGIESLINGQLQNLADTYNAEYPNQVADLGGNSQPAQSQSTVPEWMKALYDSSNPVFRKYYFEDAVTSGKIPAAVADAVRPIIQAEWTEGSKEAAQDLYNNWLDVTQTTNPTPDNYVDFLHSGVLEISGFQGLYNAMDRTAFDSLAADLGVQNYQPRFPNDAAVPQNNGDDNGGNNGDGGNGQDPSKSGNSGTQQQNGNKDGNAQPDLDPDWSDASTPDKIVDSVVNELKTRWGINAPSDFASADKQMAAVFTDLQQQSKAATGKAWPQDIVSKMILQLREATETLYDSLPGVQAQGQDNDQSQENQSSDELWNEGGANQQQQSSGRTAINNDPGTNVDTTKPNYNSGNKPGSDPTTDKSGTDKTSETLPDDILPARKRRVVRRDKRQAPVRLSL